MAAPGNITEFSQQLHAVLTAENTTSDRIQALEKILDGADGKDWQKKISELVSQLLPAEALVPDAYKQWRPLVRDGFTLLFSKLSTSRLAEKIVAQWQLPFDSPVEKRLAKIIARMPGLQKLGQVVARNPHLDSRLREQLTRLENEVADANVNEILSSINQELGQALKAYAVQMDDNLLAEASVSAVIGFTWSNPQTKNRERGVFKVLKPYVPEYFAEDIDLLQQVATSAAFQQNQYGFDCRPAPDTIAETCRLLEYEVDFRREQANLEQARAAYKDMPKVVIPQVIEQLSSEGITAMTETSGVKITEAFRNDAEWREKVACQALEALIAAPLFSEADSAVFHADPHAGNLLYDERNCRLIVLDWALMETLSREQRRNIVMLTLMLTLRDSAGASSLVRQLSLENKETRLIDESVDKFIRAMPIGSVPGSADVMRMLDELALAGVAFPAPLLMFRKARFTLDGVLHDLTGTNANLDATLLSYFVRRWMASPAAAFLPLWPEDWFPLQLSAVNYPARLWMSMAIDAFRAYRLGLLAN